MVLLVKKNNDIIDYQVTFKLTINEKNIMYKK